MDLGSKDIVLGPLYYPISENKGADQLRGYRAADLRLCFHICRTLVFSRRGSKMRSSMAVKMTIFSCIFHLHVSFFFLFFKHRLRVHILTRSDTNQAAQSATGDG